MWGVCESAWLGSGPLTGPSHLAHSDLAPGMLVFFTQGKSMSDFITISAGKCVRSLFESVHMPSAAPGSVLLHRFKHTGIICILFCVGYFCFMQKDLVSFSIGFSKHLMEAEWGGKSWVKVSHCGPTEETLIPQATRKLVPTWRIRLKPFVRVQTVYQQWALLSLQSCERLRGSPCWSVLLSRTLNTNQLCSTWSNYFPRWNSLCWHSSPRAVFSATPSCVCTSCRSVFSRCISANPNWKRSEDFLHRGSKQEGPWGTFGGTHS